MSDIEAKTEVRVVDRLDTTNAGLPAAKVSKPRLRAVPLVITLAATALAIVAGALMWDAYMGAPWTRDATVRTYVVTMAPEVAGRIVQLPVKNNQFVKKGDLLLVIDPTDYKNALDSAEANVEQARATALNAKLQLQRRQKLSDLAETVEDRQIHEANAAASQAQYQAAQVSRNQAKVNLERTQLHSPVNGWVTNLLTQVGDYASVGRNVISLVDAELILDRRLFRRDKTSFYTRRGSCEDQVDGTQRYHIGRSRQFRARYYGGECTTGSSGACKRQPYLHLGAACAARASADRHQATAGRRSPGYRIDGDRSGRAAIPFILPLRRAFPERCASFVPLPAWNGSVFHGRRALAWRHPVNLTEFPILADIVAKVENRTTPKISRTLIFGLLRGCVAL